VSELADRLFLDDLFDQRQFRRELETGFDRRIEESPEVTDELCRMILAPSCYQTATPEGRSTAIRRRRPQSVMEGFAWRRPSRTNA
jgi:hypothetical protein